MMEMTPALKDKSRLVRWRAAMFLYEVGDERVLPALKAAENDPELECNFRLKWPSNALKVERKRKDLSGNK